MDEPFVRCDACHLLEAMHHLSSANGWRQLCCECYVKDQAADAPLPDWHEVCQEAKRRRDAGEPIAGATQAVFARHGQLDAFLAAKARHTTAQP